MDIELTPDDLELNQEYYLTFHTDCDERINNIEQHDGVYSLRDIFTYYTTNKKNYHFINIENSEVIISYITDKSLFRASFNCNIFCHIKLLTNEYVLK